MDGPGSSPSGLEPVNPAGPKNGRNLFEAVESGVVYLDEVDQLGTLLDKRGMATHAVPTLGGAATGSGGDV